MNLPRHPLPRPLAALAAGLLALLTPAALPAVILYAEDFQSLAVNEDGYAQDLTALDPRWSHAPASDPLAWAPIDPFTGFYDPVNGKRDYSDIGPANSISVMYGSGNINLAPGPNLGTYGEMAFTPAAAVPAGPVYLGVTWMGAPGVAGETFVPTLWLRGQGGEKVGAVHNRNLLTAPDPDPYYETVLAFGPAGSPGATLGGLFTALPAFQAGEPLENNTARLVIGYDPATGLTSLWTNPTGTGEAPAATYAAAPGLTIAGFSVASDLRAGTLHAGYALDDFVFATTFAEAAAGTAGVDPNADPDGDGRANLIEWLARTAPWQEDEARSMSAELTAEGAEVVRVALRLPPGDPWLAGDEPWAGWRLSVERRADDGTWVAVPEAQPDGAFALKIHHQTTRTQVLRLRLDPPTPQP